MHIVISEFMDDAAVQALSRDFEVRYDPGLVERRPALIEAVAGADALIVRNRTQVDAALLAAAPRLRAVGRLGVGLDNIDLPGCRARGIEVLPATGANARAVAEYVIASTLLLLRGAYGRSADIGQGAWPRDALSSGREAAQRTLGLVGFGGIGQLVAGLARGIGMRVIAHDPALDHADPRWADSGVEPCTLDSLLGRADVVSLHLPLTPQTRHLIDATRLAAMRPGAVLINTARGGIVDETALAAALRGGHLGGAAVDVFETEPPSGPGPLAGLGNVLLTPHIAGLTQEANLRVSRMVAERVAQALRART